jgi:hypothetical protein
MRRLDFLAAGTDVMIMHYAWGRVGVWWVGFFRTSMAYEIHSGVLLEGVWADMQCYMF